MFIRLITVMGEVATLAGKTVGTIANKAANMILTKLKKKDKNVEKLTAADEKEIKENAEKVAEVASIFTTVGLIWLVINIDLVFTVLIISAISDIVLFIYKAVQHMKPNLA